MIDFQDSFLPHIEDGTIALLGATTENPSFHLNNALTSRCRVVVLHQLETDTILTILRKAVTKLHGVEQSDEEKENEQDSSKEEGTSVDNMSSLMWISWFC